ncbi:hypothetical protein OVA24_03210 [Luteolibacter sp. SL250]|uniref:hypothetical protein n=1 Tax=Luteolibacter sp. SL250 TaxID=2995170 RepID=UPI002271B509|nr:hypothetical protein [Luteolibacter sp. SL250]WAC20386.1 hypothetical protein OVA24_03210 [Luteolibacter sp. SL250]
MGSKTLREVLPRQLRFWSLHCTLNALPSLAIALGWLGLWKSGVAILAMMSAIVSFILLYAVVTSVVRPLADGDSILSRALKLGTKTRSLISGGSLLAVTTGMGVPFTPDFWCGFGASVIVDSLRTIAEIGAFPAQFEPDVPRLGNVSFGSIYLTTMLEGLLLSMLLFMLSFFCVILLQRRDRKMAYASGSPVGEAVN